MNAPALSSAMRPTGGKVRDLAMVDFLREMVMQPCARSERFHAVFLDQESAFIESAPLGYGGAGSLSVRMREVLGMALELDAHGLLLAHNHPSGQCRPSQRDIEATCRLKRVAQALDIALLDHLIFTHDAVYSMRAGGKL